MRFGMQKIFADISFKMFNFVYDKMVASPHLADEAYSRDVKELINTEIQVLEKRVETGFFFFSSFNCQ